MILFPCNPAITEQSVEVQLKPLPAKVFTYPFFDDGVLAEKQVTHLPPVSIDDCAEPESFIRPTAFIFHVSHCGSTLLGQLLGCDEKNRILSEPELVNNILLQKTFAQTSDEVCISRLQKSIKLLLQPLQHETHAFIKFTSWNIFHATLLLKAFPEVPVWFIYRDITEVIPSLIKHPNGFASWHQHSAPVLAASYLGFTFDEIKAMPTAAYLEHMLQLHLFHALNDLPAHTLLLTFPNWLPEFPSNISSFYQPNENTLQKMKERLMFDAKHAAKKFSLQKDNIGLTSDNLSQRNKYYTSYQKIKSKFRNQNNF